MLTEQSFKRRGSPTTTQSCALDRVGDKPAGESTAVTQKETVLLSGWAADAANRNVPEVIAVELVGEKDRYYASATRVKREGIVKALKSPGLLYSGFDLLASFKDIDPGEYTVHIYQVAASGEAFLCNTRKKITVEEPAAEAGAGAQAPSGQADNAGQAPVRAP